MSGTTNEQELEQAAAAAFAEGFDEATPTAAAATEPAPASETEGGREPVEVEFVQVTKKDFDRLMAAAEKAETVDATFNKVFGTIGNVKNELLQRVQAMTPTGAEIKLSDEDFAELKEDFPELAGKTKSVLERVFAKVNLRGTGEQPAPVEVDPEKVREAVKEARIQDELQALSDLHPGWRTIVGKPDEDNDFRRWLKQQPQDYQDRVKNTLSANVTARAIDKFLADKEVQTTQPPARPNGSRRERFEEAVQPRGTGTPPPPKRSTPEDDFHAGFSSG
jgi:hypothetical protein